MASKIQATLVFIGFLALAWAASEESQAVMRAVRNVKFQVKNSRVEFHYRIFALRTDLLKKVKKDEQKACLDEKKDQALKEVENILGETWISLETKYDEAAKAVAKGAEDEVAKFVNNNDYESLKTKTKRAFVEKMVIYVKALSEDMNKCVL